MTLPFPTWLRGYDRRWVGADVVAGLTTAAVVLPKALGIAATAALHLPGHGVKVIGANPAGLPSPVLPDLGLVRVLWSAAVGIALMSFTGTIAAGRAFVAHGDHPLWVAALNPEVRAVVKRWPLGERLGQERMCFNLEDAVARFEGAPAHAAEGTS